MKSDLLNAILKATSKTFFIGIADHLIKAVLKMISKHNF